MTDDAKQGEGSAPSQLTEENLPHAIAEGSVRIGNVELRAIQLDNGQRVFEAESIEQFFAALEDGSLALTKEDAEAVMDLMRRPLKATARIVEDA